MIPLPAAASGDRPRSVGPARLLPCEADRERNRAGLPVRSSREAGVAVPVRAYSAWILTPGQRSL